MTSLLRGVVNWLDGSTEGLQENENCVAVVAEGNLIQGGTAERRDSESNVEATEIKDSNFDETAERNSKAAIKEDLMEVSMKAVHAAKEWGGYLYSIGKMTGGQVTRTAEYLKSALDVQMFADDAASSTENQLAGRRRSSDGSPVVAPWVGCIESENMKSQILALSQDKENFLRGPPPGVEFYFNYPVNHPLAQVMLEEDSNLKMMRFELVPKQVREESFWQNYFYRVSLIKQSLLARHAVIDRPSSVDHTAAHTYSLNADDVDQKHFDVLGDYTGPLDEPDLDDFELVSAADLDTAE